MSVSSCGSAPPYDGTDLWSNIERITSRRRQPSARGVTLRDDIRSHAARLAAESFEMGAPRQGRPGKAAQAGCTEPLRAANAIRYMTIQQKFDLTGRVAIVTGGVGLLGAEFCRTLAEAGAAVVVVDLNAPTSKVDG